jgi:hypothetical protein
MNELVRKVEAATSFSANAAEVKNEVQDLVNQNLYMERLLLRVRSMCEADGVSPTVAAIRKVIDDGSFS